ncbi:MAG: transposase [Elusimicrobia bacterium]|nr:transposase [Elusimicrobiota bacterium]
MPRLARIDFPGLLHHVIARGINRQAVFIGKPDYADFLERVETSKEKVPNEILAWALMPNHFHLLIRSGPKGMIPFMRRLMTGYAGAFNLRHQRTGHLFSNRYKSIVCDENSYLLELVRYIHLNPLRAGLVKTVKDLEEFPYTGHSVLLKKNKAPWQSTEVVLRLFSKKLSTARDLYLSFIGNGASQGHREDLVGGGLGRSLGGAPRQVPHDSLKDRQLYDSRVLGSGDFVESVLKVVEKEEEIKRSIVRENLSLDEIGQRVADKCSINVEWLYLRNRTHRVSEAKALLVFLATEYLGKNNVEMSRLVKMTPAAAGRARMKGFNIAREINAESWMKVN